MQNLSSLKYSGYNNIVTSDAQTLLFMYVLLILHSDETMGEKGKYIALMGFAFAIITRLEILDQLN